MSTINQKLGLRPATRKRPMMRGVGKDAALVARTSRQCHCGHRWVIENVIHGVRRSMCCWCHAFDDQIEGTSV